MGDRPALRARRRVSVAAGRDWLEKHGNVHYDGRQLTPELLERQIRSYYATTRTTGPGDDVAADYSTTAFWYGAATPSLRRTDTLTVGNAASERDHGYTSSGPGPVTTLTSAFEGTNAPLTAATRSTNAPVTFRMAVDPANRGVVLRRVGDQNTAYQNARVSVDGHALPDWLQPLGNTTHRWLDDEYQLPASVTAGRHTLTVTLTPGGPGLDGGVVRRVERPVTDEAPVTLAMRGIAKSFPGVRALSGVDLTVRAGEVARRTAPSSTCSWSTT